MSKKIRVTQELIDKAEAVFAKVRVESKDERSTIRTNEGLSRGELKALERKGIVERLGVFGARKWQDVVGAKCYVWRLVKTGLLNE